MPHHTPEKTGLISDHHVKLKAVALARSKWLKWVNLLSFIASVSVNALGAVGKISGYAVGNVSDTYATKFTPAGWAFSIWGIIYTGLAGFVIWQLLPRNKDCVTLWIDFGFLFAASNVLNAVWIIVWVQNTDACVILACLLLLTLLGVVMLIITRAQTWARARPGGALEFVVIDVTFSIYGGWLTVASAVNVTAALVACKWDGSPWTEEGWCVIMVCVAAAIFLTFILRRKDGVYGLVYTWAVQAIASANNAAGNVSNTIYKASMAMSVLVGAASVAMILYRAWKAYRGKMSA